MSEERRRRKRAHGEGTIYFHQGTQRWCAEVTYWQEGQLKRKAVYGKTQREVQQKLQQLRQLLTHGLPPAPEKLTVGDYCEQWLAANRSRLRPKTQRAYEQIVRLYVRPLLGRTKLSGLTPTMVEQWLRRLEADGKAPRTLQHARAVLRRILQDALRDGLCARNAAALARPVSVPPPATSTWDFDEAQQFLEATRDHWLWPLFAITLALGLRQGEALGLSWEDTDLDEGLVLIRWQLQQVKGQWQRLPPKSKQSRRMLPLPPLAREALVRQHEQQRAWREQARGEWRGNPWSLVFTTHVGTPLSARNVTRIFHQLCQQAGVPPIRFHDLRHSTATLLLHAGVDLKTVSAVLGHSQLSVTADYYAHVTRAVTQPALARLSALLQD
jgi:integrase